MRRGQNNGSGTTIDRSQVYGERFDSITQFEHAISTREITSAFSYDPSSQKTGDYRHEWTGTKDYDEANNLLLYGDAESKARIDDKGVASVIKQTTRTERQRMTVLSPCGFLPHVPNFLAGRPNNMLSERITLKRKKVINVCYNIVGSASVDANDLQNEAANALSAILIAERHGVRINLWAVEVTSEGGNYEVMAIKIKDSAQHIDLLKMAYPLTHPSMLRRHGFKFKETLAGLPSGFAHGYGRPEYDDNKIKQCLSYIGVDVDAILSYKKCQTMGREDMINEITQVNN